MEKIIIFLIVLSALPSEVRAQTEGQTMSAMSDYFAALNGDKEAEHRFVEFIKSNNNYTAEQKQERLAAFYQQQAGDESLESVPGPTAEAQKARAMEARELGRQRAAANRKAQVDIANLQRSFDEQNASTLNEHYKAPNEEDRNMANAGYDLFKRGHFSGQFKGGEYTDPNPSHQGFEFWSNGTKAFLDRDFNGHHETVFAIQEDEMEYVGSINSSALYVDVGQGYEEYLGKHRDAPFSD